MLPLTSCKAPQQSTQEPSLGLEAPDRLELQEAGRKRAAPGHHHGNSRSGEKGCLVRAATPGGVMLPTAGFLSPRSCLSSKKRGKERERYLARRHPRGRGDRAIAFNRESLHTRQPLAEWLPVFCLPVSERGP